MDATQQCLCPSMEDDYVEEACFYLAESKTLLSDIAEQFNLSLEQAELSIKSYKEKIESGEKNYDEQTKDFWAKNYKESSGDEKVTLVDEKGRYYHGWKSEIGKMSTEELVNLLVINKRYSDSHPLSEFSKTQAVTGYVPLIPLRNIRRTISIIDEALQKREKSEAT